MPEGDVLIHAGDATDFGTVAEFTDFFSWFSELPYAYKVFVPGNHDLSLDEEGYRSIHMMWKAAGRIRKLSSSNPADVAQVIPARDGAFFLLVGPVLGEVGRRVESVVVCGYRLFGCSRTRKVRIKNISTAGIMAFNLNDDDEAEEIWNQIPSDMHILVTHGPSLGVLDDFHGLQFGDGVLGRHVERVRPLVHICGHVHPGYGSHVMQHTETECTTVINCAIGHAAPGQAPRQPIVFDLPRRDIGDQSPRAAGVQAELHEP